MHFPNAQVLKMLARIYFEPDVEPISPAERGAANWLVARGLAQAGATLVITDRGSELVELFIARLEEER